MHTHKDLESDFQQLLNYIEMFVIASLEESLGAEYFNHFLPQSQRLSEWLKVILDRWMSTFSETNIGKQQMQPIVEKLHNEARAFELGDTFDKERVRKARAATKVLMDALEKDLPTITKDTTSLSHPVADKNATTLDQDNGAGVGTTVGTEALMEFERPQYHDPGAQAAAAVAGPDIASHGLAFSVPARENSTGFTRFSVVLDGSNIAWRHGNGQRWSPKGILIASEAFLHEGFSPIYVFLPEDRLTGPALSDQRDEGYRQLIIQLLHDGHDSQVQIIMIPKGDYDDAYLVRHAFRTGSVLLSNDRYEDYLDQVEAERGPAGKAQVVQWMRNCRISYTFSRDTLLPNPSVNIIEAVNHAQTQSQTNSHFAATFGL